MDCGIRSQSSEWRAKMANSICRHDTCGSCRTRALLQTVSACWCHSRCSRFRPAWNVVVASATVTWRVTSVRSSCAYCATVTRHISSLRSSCAYCALHLLSIRFSVVSIATQRSACHHGPLDFMMMVHLSFSLGMSSALAFHGLKSFRHNHSLLVVERP